jgi:hypothetical protein
MILRVWRKIILTTEVIGGYLRWRYDIEELAVIFLASESTLFSMEIHILFCRGSKNRILFSLPPKKIIYKSSLFQSRIEFFSIISWFCNWNYRLSYLYQYCVTYFHRFNLCLPWVWEHAFHILYCYHQSAILLRASVWQSFCHFFLYLTGHHPLIIYWSIL